MEKDKILNRIKFIEKEPDYVSFVEFCENAHHSTNHYYDEYLDYSFHLRMVVKNGKDFLYLIDESLWENILKAAWGHDVIEDARKNYKAVLNASNIYVAEICRACTNYGRGRTREERMPDFIYEDIFKTPGAVFVKLCDRIANVQYSKLTGSNMFLTYKKEHKHFKEMLYSKESGLDAMWNYLEKLFNIED